MNRTDRLLAILLELQSNRIRRAEDLAATFETSKRTIYRDLQALGEAGVPVVALPGQGFSLVDGFFLPPVTFTSEEATMMILGSEYIAEHFGDDYRNSASSASLKIRAVLPEPLRAGVEQFRERFCFVSPTVWTGPESMDKLRTVRQAILEQKSLRVLYHTRYAADGKSERNLREIDPYALVNAVSWYLVAYCRLRRAIRYFRLDRIERVEILERTFERPESFRLGAPGDNESRNVVVKLLFDPEIIPWVRESRSYYAVNEEETPEGYLVTCRVHRESEIVQWILGWGSRVRVLEPASLSRYVLEEARKTISRNCAERLLT